MLLAMFLWVASLSCKKTDSPGKPVVLASLTTTNISTISQTTAESGGDVTADGGAKVTHRGVCWNTAGNPRITDNLTTGDGSGIGIFTSSLTGLSANTTYYVRAFAINSAGTSYGNLDSFITQPAPPVLATLTTQGLSLVTDSSAQSGGLISSDGAATVTARGVCWSTSQNPTTADSLTNNGTGPGSFVSSLQGLMANTTYYLRAYATNSVGTAYGNLLSFATPISTMDSLKIGLVAYYPFSGNAKDSSGNGNDGTVYGATLSTDRFGKPNSAYNFNGINSSITAPNQSWLNFGMTSFTLSAWVNLNAVQLSNFNGILTKGDTIITVYQMGVDSVMAGGEFGNPYLMDFAHLQSSPLLQPGTWTLITMVVDVNNNQVNLFVNGVLAASYQSPLISTQNISSTDPLRIGVERNLLDYINGQIDEVRIYSRVLTNNEILFLFNH